MTQHVKEMATRTDANAVEWLIDDELTHLREWGTHRIHVLPPANEEVTIGAAEGCELRLNDSLRIVSREHARLRRGTKGWAIRDLDSKNGTRIDGARRLASPLPPGVEIGIGRTTLIAESRALIALRGFLARLLGWGGDRVAVVDRALRAVRAAAHRRAALVVCGKGDLVSIAYGLHRRTLGEDRPFVFCDPRRQSAPGSARVAASYREGLPAFAAAAGGTLCMRARRLPQDFSQVSLALREPGARVRLAMCTDDAADAATLLADPILVPPLATRRAELARIVDEYARDAITSLGAGPADFPRGDRDWVMVHSAASLPEVEKGTLRLVAIRQAGSLAGAATRLGMSHVALSQWLGRRRLT